MKDGEVKHSSLLTDEDLVPEREHVRRMEAVGVPVTYWKNRTIRDIQAREGFYVMFWPKTRPPLLAGPYKDVDEAIDAHREAAWSLQVA